MSNIFTILVACVVAMAEDKIDPKWVAPVDTDDSKPEQGAMYCDADSHVQRSELIEAARCGSPKETFVILKPEASYEEVHPGGVWVKRCIGLCDHEGPASNCTAHDTVIRMIPIKIYNLLTNKERCSLYAVEEHLSCRCCDRRPKDCIAPKVYFPRKCSCHCGNVEEHKYCIARGPKYHEWHADKCICEEKETV